MKFKNHRNGIEMDALVIIILGIILIIALTFIAYKFYLSQAEKLKTDSCKGSIMAHSFMASATAGDIFTKIKCPTTYLTLNPNDAEKTKKAIAEDMHKCWYEWNRGKGNYFKGDGTFCYVCGVYDFTDRSKRVDGMMQYFFENSISVRYPGDKPGWKYADYFQGYSSTEASGLIKDPSMEPMIGNDYLDSSQKYSSIFIYTSNKTFMQKTLEGGGRSTLGTAGLFAVTGGGLAIAGSTAASIFIASNPVGWIVGGVAGVAIGVTAIYTSVVVKAQPDYISFIILQPYDAQSFKDIGCTELAVSQESHSKP